MISYSVDSHVSKIGAIGVALGSGASGVYTNSSYLWENMHKVSERKWFKNNCSLGLCGNYF